MNWAYRRSGTLWEGRFKSCLAQNEDYVLTCDRYIELNPVRAGMVTAPADYRWSSYRANGLGKADALVQPHEQYVRLGSIPGERPAACRALFTAEVDPEQLSAIRQATNGNFALGDRRFQTEIERMLERRAAPGKSGRPRRRGNIDG